jgi:hypothetical protein
MFPTQVPTPGTLPNAPNLFPLNEPSRAGTMYYLSPSAQPLYLPQWRGGADPSANVAPRATAPVLVNPGLYPNGVIIRQYNSPNPYSPLRYIIAPPSSLPRR